MALEKALTTEKCADTSCNLPVVKARLLKHYHQLITALLLSMKVTLFSQAVGLGRIRLWNQGL